MRQEVWNSTANDKDKRLDREDQGAENQGKQGAENRGDQGAENREGQNGDKKREKELEEKELDYRDSCYQVIIGVLVKKR